MKLIRKEPNPGGDYPAIQEMSLDWCPDGMAVWPEDLDTSVFYQYNGFVKLTIEDEDGIPVVSQYVPNTEDWEKWKASLPEPGPEPEPEPTEDEDRDAMLVDHELRLTMLELGL